jgi:hypothetical protein
MDDIGTPFFIMGLMLGVLSTLIIQYYGRRKVSKALQQEGLTPSRKTELLSQENEGMKGQILRLEERLSVMERITTDSHMNLSSEIERLR